MAVTNELPRRTPDIVVDIGNTSMKWGWGVDPMQMAFLPGDDTTAWGRQLGQIVASRQSSVGSEGPNGPRGPLVLGADRRPPAADCRLAWAMASVHPPRTKRFVEWAESRGDSVRVLTRHDIPLSLDVEEPDQTGIDRLLNAYAAHRKAKGREVLVVSVGTAVTVDRVDTQGVYRGGAIFPGPRLMANALHSHTALLPKLDVPEVPRGTISGRTTRDCILKGIQAAIVGGVRIMATECRELDGTPYLFLTGGALGSLADLQFGDMVHAAFTIPTLTLEGIFLAAERS